VERAQRIVSAQDETPAAPPSLTDEFTLRRRLLAGYEMVRAQWPDRLAAIATRIDRYEAALAAAGLDPRQLAAGRYTLARVARYSAKAVLVLLVLLPAALIGVVLNYPAYRVVGFVATGMAKGAEDALASIKVLAAMLLFPLTWTIVAVLVGMTQGVEAGVVALILAPLLAYAALIFFERLDRIIGGARALTLFAFRRWAFLRLLAERHAIRDEIIALGRTVETA
jgi:glycerol-3-phosphate O-acyltransferase / dihydroxyacetone phosphate acyltransferase